MEKKQLSDHEFAMIEEAVRKTGKSRQELLRELLSPILSSRSSQTIKAPQNHKLVEALERIRAIPVTDEPNDGICASVDHDKILYGSE